MSESIWANVASFLGEASPEAALPSHSKSGATKPAKEKDTAPALLFVLCFSKDRPFQLLQFIRSFLLADLKV